MAPGNDSRIDNTLALGIVVAAGDEESVSFILWELGTMGIESRDIASQEVQLIAYFGANGPVEIEKAVASRLNGALRKPIAILPVQQVDWKTHWRRSFQPVTIGSLTIAPPWNLPDVARERLLVIDPGRAFGTGAHETTQLCLELVEQILRREPLSSVLDVGTGTGVLAIAAARLGAPFVVACDIDDDSIQSSRVHADKNGVAVSILRADGSRALRPASFDVVVANLSMPFLVERGAGLRAMARRFLVLSGFLGEDVASLGGASIDPRSTFHFRGDWAALVQDLT
ncbi:MAG: 50S ribosomal protein L11 methyltransferase [Vicinamibacteria bacterium]|nr:50S ribosomal protein L11 methyltransferase [Vicinamibacteria bacterium]